MSTVGTELVLGFGVGASFGPVNLEITRTGLVGRAEDTTPLAIGTWTGDALLLGVLVVAIASASEAGQVDTGGLGFRIVAATLILAIAIPALAHGPSSSLTEGERRAPIAHTVAKGVALSALSPYGIVLWAGIGASVAASDHSLLSLFLVLAGDALWFVVWLFLLRKARSRVSPRAVLPIHVGANSALIAYAVVLVASSS